MKRFFVLSLFISLFLGSCSQIDEQIDSVEKKSSLVSFVARIDNSMSRTYSEECEDGGIQMYWHEEDLIMVSDGVSGRCRYKLASGAGTTEATFVLDESYANNVEFTGTEFYAVSPFVSGSYSSIKKLRMNIQTLQTNVGQGTCDDKRNTMVAHSKDGGLSFDFKLVSSLLRFDVRLEDGEMIKQIRIDSESAKISGSADVDWQRLELASEGAQRYIEFNYTNPVASPNSDGWVQMYPIDWSQVEGNVYYTVTTDKHIYKFCKKPTKATEAGYIYTVPLWLDSFESVASEGELADGKCYTFEDGKSVHAALVRITDSTVTVGWTVSLCNVNYVNQIVPQSDADYTVDIEKVYKVAIYSDAECKTLVSSVSNIHKKSDTTSSSKYVMLNNMAPPRFAFADLTPETKYYIKVWNTTDNTVSNVIEVTTKQTVANKADVVTDNAKAGDLILFENFASIIYGGEMTSRGASISRTDRGSLTTIAPVTGGVEIESGKDNYVVCSSGNEIGLFNTLKGLIDDFGLQDWGWIGGKAGATGGSVCARPGYVKVGTGSNRAVICTPKLSAIPEGKAARLRVVFSAAPYGEYNSNEIASNDRKMSVRAILENSITNYGIDANEAFEAQYLTLTSSISAWRTYTVYLENVPPTARIALGSGVDVATTTSRVLVDDIRIFVEEITDYVPPKDPDTPDPVTGTVTYSDGTPAAGVAVSDGFTVVKTDSEGKYSLKPHIDTWYIYYSIPADCQVPINSYGQPEFFTRYSATKSVYDFTLTKLDAVEREFTLFCLADPQCRRSRQTGQTQLDGDRFINESVPAIKAHVGTKSVPCYGVTLGDIVYSEGSRNCESFMSTMRGYMAADKMGMPIFQTMGNHDYLYFSSGNPLAADATSSTYNMKAQRAFEDVFGPINYSWNRGDAHIISMRNMIWNSTTAWDGYSLGFTAEQVEWLRQDLATVEDKNKLIIFCVHIPMRNASSVNSVVSLLQQFPNCHIMAGHTHYMRNEPTKTPGIYEHIHAAVSGQWWWSKINGDGCPNGYGVYDIEGNTIKNWYYMGINEGMNDREYQMRLYRGDLICGDNTFALQHGSDVILANVFNAGPDWTVEIFADGVSEGKMEFIKEKRYKEYCYEVPTDSCQDWWAIGYHVGVVGRTSSSYYVNNFHMYKHTLTNKQAKEIRVEATDPFGRKYTCSEVIYNDDNKDIYSVIR